MTNESEDPKPSKFIEEAKRENLIAWLRAEAEKDYRDGGHHRRMAEEALRIVQRAFDLTGDGSSAPSVEPKSAHHGEMKSYYGHSLKGFDHPDLVTLADKSALDSLRAEMRREMAVAIRLTTKERIEPSTLGLGAKLVLDLSMAGTVALDRLAQGLPPVDPTDA